MAPARRSPWLRAGLVLALAAAANSASAQAAKPHQRPKPVASTPPDNAIGDNSTGDVSPSVTGSKPLTVRAAAPPPLPGPVLRSAVHSRYSQPVTIARSTAGQCRARCAESRTTCSGGQGDLSGCDPGWTECLSSCDGLTYSRGP